MVVGHTAVLAGAAITTARGEGQVVMRVKVGAMGEVHQGKTMTIQGHENKHKVNKDQVAITKTKTVVGEMQSNVE